MPTHPLPLQLDIGLWKRDHRWHCARTFERQHRQQEIEIFFIDTNPAIEAYQTAPFADNKGAELGMWGTAPLLRAQDLLGPSLFDAAAAFMAGSVHRLTMCLPHSRLDRLTAGQLGPAV